MATYIVFTRESTQDQNELNIYLSKVGETLEGHPVKLHAGPQQVLEGPVPEFFVILEFPTIPTPMLVKHRSQLNKVCSMVRLFPSFPLQ